MVRHLVAVEIDLEAEAVSGFGTVDAARLRAALLHVTRILGALALARPVVALGVLVRAARVRRGGERERGERSVRPVELARHEPPRRARRFLRGLLRSAIRSEFRISFKPETTLVTIEPGLFWSAVRAPDLFNLRGIFSCHPALRVRKGVRRDSAALESV